MEAVSIYALSSGAIAAATSPPSSAVASWLSARYWKWRNRKKIFGCLIMKGKTTICNKLNSRDPPFLFLDVDTLYEKYAAPAEANTVNQIPSQLENYMIYPLIREHIQRCSQLYKGSIVLVSSNLDLLKSCPVYFSQIHFFPFSKEMEENIGVIFPSEKEHTAATINKFRYLREIPATQTTVVESLGDMEKKIKEKFGINTIAI